MLAPRAGTAVTPVFDNKSRSLNLRSARATLQDLVSKQIITHTYTHTHTHTHSHTHTRTSKQWGLYCSHPHISIKNNWHAHGKEILSISEQCERLPEPSDIQQHCSQTQALLILVGKLNQLCSFRKGVCQSLQVFTRHTVF